MSEYTPTTEHVRDLTLRLMNADEFDAWLAKVKADAEEAAADVATKAPARKAAKAAAEAPAS